MTTNIDVQENVTQAFDNIVNVAWEGAKSSEASKLSKKQAYELINQIQKEVTKLKKILYTRA